MSSKDTNPKDAIGAGKPPTRFVPLPVLYEVGLALLEGACKYGGHNWRVVGVRASVYQDACKRHLDAWWEGEDIDQDSGVHHISKAIAGLMVIRDSMMRDNHTDDRPPKAQEGWMKKIEEQAREVLARYPEPLPPYTQADTAPEQTDPEYPIHPEDSK